jgi:hypothetical protein
VTCRKVLFSHALQRSRQADAGMKVMQFRSMSASSCWPSGISEPPSGDDPGVLDTNVVAALGHLAPRDVTEYEAQ